MEIRYDVTDWEQNYNQNQSVRPASADDAVDLMRESNTRVSDISVALIVGRELGKVKDETLPSNKLSNLLGMSLHRCNPETECNRNYRGIATFMM